MFSNTDLTEHQWQTAYTIAIELVKEQNRLDASSKGLISELEKSLVYLRNYVDQDDIGQRFLKYLDTLKHQGNRIGHSKKTEKYYQSISDVCKQYLKVYENNPAVMLQIMGWVKRLMRYYSIAEILDDVNLDEIRSNVGEVTSERQLEIAQVFENQTFEKGQEIEAKVTDIKGNKVTYCILDTLKLTQKEPKEASNLTVDQTVTVEIAELKEDGTIKKVKYKK